MKTIFAEYNVPTPDPDVDLLEDDFTIGQAGGGRILLHVESAAAAVVHLHMRPRVDRAHAVGELAVVQGSELVDGDKFTLNDGANWPLVFKFVMGSGINADVFIPIVGNESADEIAVKVAQAINAASHPLAIEATAQGSVVKLRNTAPGVAGVQEILEEVAAAGFIAEGMAFPPEVTSSIANPRMYEHPVSADFQYNLRVATAEPLRQLFAALLEEKE